MLNMNFNVNYDLSSTVLYSKVINRFSVIIYYTMKAKLNFQTIDRYFLLNIYLFNQIRNFLFIAYMKLLIFKL
jgi:hypothetical protein